MCIIYIELYIYPLLSTLGTHLVFRIHKIYMGSLSAWKPWRYFLLNDALQGFFMNSKLLDSIFMMRQIFQCDNDISPFCCCHTVVSCSGSCVRMQPLALGYSAQCLAMRLRASSSGSFSNYLQALVMMWSCCTSWQHITLWRLREKERPFLMSCR